MFNPLSKMNVSTLGLDADLLEAAKKIKENDPYNPSGSGPARLPSEPSSSGKMIKEEYCTCGCDCGKKVCKTCGKPHKAKDIKKEDVDLEAKPGYNKTVRGYE